MFVRPAQPLELPQVHRLHHDAWVDEGFLFPRLDGVIDRHPEFDADARTQVLVAVDDTSIVGTNSITIDGPLGLPVDHGLESTIDSIRASTKRLAAAWRVATQPQLRASASVIRTLMLETIQIAIDREVTTCLFLFHTRHVPVYRRLLRAKTVRHVGTYYADAPTWDCVLMRVDADDWGADGYRAMHRSLLPRTPDATDTCRRACASCACVTAGRRTSLTRSA